MDNGTVHGSVKNMRIFGGRKHSPRKEAFRINGKRKQIINIFQAEENKIKRLKAHETTTGEM